MQGGSDGIAGFLEGIGLSQLIETFDAQDIDMSVLPMLDQSDLKELGLTIGQRKKLTAALAALKEAAPSSKVPEGAEAEIQLRRLSVLFSDMVGSTELGVTLGIDDMQLVLQHYYDLAKQVVQRHGGYVIGTQGDGIVAVFGYPHR